MAVFEVAQPPKIAPVEGARSGRERLRDALDPLWRRALWAITERRSAQAPSRRLYSTAPIELSEAESALAREILARRLSR
jgi:hypothetical protein